MKLALYDLAGKEKEELKIEDKIKDFKVSDTAIHDTVVMNLANKRSGVACTKTKGEVSYSGIKLWKQKGTGRARAHYRSAVHLKGGAPVFGPKPRDFSYNIPKKVKQLALKSAFVKSLNSSDVVVIDKLEIGEPKTKLLSEILKKLGDLKKVLIVGKEMNPNVKLAVRNIPGSDFRTVDKIGTFDIVSHAKILIENEAFEEIKKRY